MNILVKLGFQDINMILRMVMTWGSGPLRWEARSLCGNHTRPDATQRTGKHHKIRWSHHHIVITSYHGVSSKIMIIILSSYSEPHSTRCNSAHWKVLYYQLIMCKKVCKCAKKRLEVCKKVHLKQKCSHCGWATVAAHKEGQILATPTAAVKS